MTGAAQPPVPELPVQRLVLWRHGRTEWNAAGRFQGQLDPPLDAEGRTQAVRVAPHLAAGLPADGTVVVSSDLSRAADTAAALTAFLGVPLRLDPRLREHGMGCWEGLTRDEVAERYPEQFADWIAGRPVRDRGGEDAAHVASRAVAALADLPPTPVAVVVTHGGTAGRLLERLLNLGPEHRRVFAALDNCAWTELAYQGSRWRMVRHNMTVDLRGDGPAGNGRENGGTATHPAQPGDADAVV
ncbi:MAG: Phosphoglycerate mutase [Blastococcus sp.]|nr:Phosphoglycerate mutase [Blastococcus sp.]